MDKFGRYALCTWITDKKYYVHCMYPNVMPAYAPSSSFSLYSDAALLVEEMFQFLTLLSHEHHATKSFVDVPKVLNLCDILVSSEYASNSGQLR